MASAAGSSLPCEDQFVCSICLHAFSEPVSTPCGHNYCKTCIAGYWDSSQRIQCPICKKKFRHRPELRVNTEFRDMVERFSDMGVSGEDGDALAGPGEVPCDICLGPKLRALKTCLVCLASYCRQHLEPHQRVPTLGKHRLIHPVSNLEDRVCKKHDKVLELFCRVEQTCVCYMCLTDDHESHSTVPLEHEFKERKAWLENVTREIKTAEDTTSRSIKEIKRSVEQSKTELDKEMADIDEVFTALVASLRRSQAALMEVIQARWRAVEQRAADRVAPLEVEVGELRRRRSEMEQLLKKEDPVRLIQGCPSLYPQPVKPDEASLDPQSTLTPAVTLGPSDINPQSYVEMVKKAAAQMEEILSSEMHTLIQEVWLSANSGTVEQPNGADNTLTDELNKEAWIPSQDKLMLSQHQLCNAVDVTLNAYTANSYLSVYADGKQVQGQHYLYGLLGGGFLYQPLVLGKYGFSSGRHYYEVWVSGSKGWLLGVVKEPDNPALVHLPTIKRGGWTFIKMRDRFEDTYYVDGVSTVLQLSQDPQTVGVFVDCENGEVSFYDVENRRLIYSYRGCSFNDTTPGLKGLLRYVAGTFVDMRPKLYPIFGIFANDNNNVLAITPIARTI